MKETEIRNWLKEKKLADEWWVMLNGEELDDATMTLDEVFKLHRTVPHKEIMIVQVSEQESKDPKLFTLEKGAPPARKLPVKTPRKLLAKKLPTQRAKKPATDKESSAGPPETPPPGPPSSPPSSIGAPAKNLSPMAATSRKRTSSQQLRFIGPWLLAGWRL